jgi:hypothetical protein
MHSANARVTSAQWRAETVCTPGDLRRATRFEAPNAFSSCFSSAVARCLTPQCKAECRGQAVVSSDETWDLAALEQPNRSGIPMAVDRISYFILRCDHSKRRDESDVANARSTGVTRGVEWASQEQ